MLLLMSRRKMRQEANSITRDPQTQKHVMRTVGDVELESIANVQLTASLNVVLTSVKVVLEHFSLALIVFRILYIYIFPDFFYLEM